MAQGPAASRRTTSHSGSARLSLSVGKASQQAPNQASGRHPLRQDWSISYVHRPPGAKVDYEKEIRKVATFGSIESFLHLYSHLTPTNELPAVTDILVFAARIGRPGVWEEMRDGGKFTLRLQHPITPLLYESLLLALIGDQFEESDNVVGCVLSVRQAEDILSVWVEEESDSVRSGALKERILTLLSLPPSTMCEYRANRVLLDAASKPLYNAGTPTAAAGESASNHHEHHHPRQHHTHHNNHTHAHRDREAFGHSGNERSHWGGGFRERGDRDREGGQRRSGGERSGGGAAGATGGLQSNGSLWG
ncbi:hypothetical protein IAU60_000417 [Kwoniella sp. DSM 27419]